MSSHVSINSFSYNFKLSFWNIHIQQRSTWKDSRHGWNTMLKFLMPTFMNVLDCLMLKLSTYLFWPKNIMYPIHLRLKRTELWCFVFSVYRVIMVWNDTSLVSCLPYILACVFDSFSWIGINPCLWINLILHHFQNFYLFLHFVLSFLN